MTHTIPVCGELEIFLENKPRWSLRTTPREVLDSDFQQRNGIWFKLLQYFSYNFRTLYTTLPIICTASVERLFSHITKLNRYHFTDSPPAQQVAIAIERPDIPSVHLLKIGIIRPFPSSAHYWKGKGSAMPG